MILGSVVGGLKNVVEWGHRHRSAHVGDANIEGDILRDHQVEIKIAGYGDSIGRCLCADKAVDEPLGGADGALAIDNKGGGQGESECLIKHNLIADKPKLKVSKTISNASAYCDAE